MMKKSLVLLLIASLVIYWGCRKKKEEPDPGFQGGHQYTHCTPIYTPMTNPRLLSCKYKEGSYWVFKDSLSGAIDTLSVQTLSRTPYFYMFQICDTLESFRVIMAFKKETIPAFKEMTCHVFQSNVRLYNNFSWKYGDNPDEIYTINSTTTSCKMYDSLLIDNSYYKDVGESAAIQFVQTDPNRMESQSMKIFFNPEFGVLQLDFRDRLGGQLTGRRRVIARNIIR
jgi:hypothetical protein